MRTCTGDSNSPVGQWNGAIPACTGKQMMLFFVGVSVKPGLWTGLDSWTGLMDWNLD